ncbi:MAG: cupin domain-containing protein [Ardenticatenaceae bacterium]|nr:cupin domain-containing protein [Ardenticatenaceae bacterium]
MKVVHKADAESHRGNTFTGENVMERMLEAQQPGGISFAIVRFEDGARTHWHVHPGEQVLFVLEGEGHVGTEGTEVTIQPGDVVYTPPGEKHWHGATPGNSMAHMSITTVGPPEWFEAPE